MEIISWVIACTIAFGVAGTCLWIGHLLVVRITLLHTPVFVPSSDERLEAMIKLAHIKPGFKLLDLGSGDGKVVIALAQRFPSCKVIGVEFNPLLVHTARKAIQKAGLNTRVTIVQQDFWQVNFTYFDVIFLYGSSYIMKKMQAKVGREMKQGSQLISSCFPFPTQRPSKVLGEVYLYRF
ncbi:methyltransferase domain-containing protein [Candidatus Woesebacteria bacterium]|nr:methyltransferase domain-containing protein [Candidatus Woesebacteria bacterium]